MARVVNAHHFGGVEKLPPNVKYIGRPSPYGNPFSSKSGLYSKSESVALHRIELYRKIIEDKTYLQKLRDDLGDYDLACWCKHDSVFHVCHGDNYLHVLNISDRDYTRSAAYYLHQDIKLVLDSLSSKMSAYPDDGSWLDTYISFQDVLIDIWYAIYTCVQKDVPGYSLCTLLAYILIDLESARDDGRREWMEYYFLHVLWVIQRFFGQIANRDGEPIPPGSVTRKPAKKKGVRHEG